MELVTTKLSLPRIEKDIHPRPRLLQLGNEITDKRLILLTAPGGYGKTVLMVQLANTVLKPSVWYQLDSYDNDLVTFIKYLLTGIRRFYPDFGKEAFNLINFGEVNLHQQILVASVINDLVSFAKEGLFIILDDFHVITEPKVAQFVQELLSYLPQGIHLMIASRSPLPFSVDRYKVDGTILMIGVEQLRFREEEISSFFAQREQPITPKTAESLASATYGWPAALKLVKNPNHKEDQPLSYEDNQSIYDYLVAPIFNQLPKLVQSFLISTSLLDGFTPEFCNALLDRNDAEEVIEYLESQHFFLIPLTGTVKSYRYHDLLRIFLQNKIGTSRRDLLCRAAELIRESGNLIQSCEYLLRSGKTDEYLSFFVEAGRVALERGQWQTVARWLGLAREQILTNSWLSYYQAEVELYQSHLDQAEGWVRNATSLFTGEGERVGFLVTRILEAKLLRCRGKYRECLELLDGVEPEIPPEEPRKRLEVYIEKYIACCLMGRLKECDALLIKALTMVKPWNDGHLESRLCEALGNINYMLGNYSKALQMYQQGTEASPDRVLPSYYAQDNISSIYQDWGQLDKALGYAKRNVEQKEKLNLTEALPSAYHQLAGIYMDRGELKVAEELYRKAVQMLKGNNSDHFALSTILVYLAWCMSMQGKLSEAINLVEEAYRESKEQSGLALAVCREVGALVLIRAGKLETAEQMLLEAAVSLEKIGFQKSLCHCYAYLTVINHIKGISAQAEHYAVQCLEIAARLDLVQLFITHFEQLKPVLRLGLEKGSNVTFVQHLMALLGERSLSILSILAVHKEPAVRLRTVIPLAEIGTLKTKALMKDLMNDGDHDVAETAKHLAGFDNPSAIQSCVISDADNPLLEFKTLGQFRVFVDGVEINPESWRTVKVRDLMAYLIHNTEPVNTFQIIEDLWPQFDQKKAATNFHTTLYQLRQRLKQVGCDNPVEHGNRHYFIQPVSYRADYQRYENLVKAHLQIGVSKENAANLEEALKLYCGNYLADLDYEWVIPKQEYLKRLYFDACMALSDYYLELQEFNLAINHLQSVQANNPFNEDVYCRLMTAYAGKGDRAAVRKEFERLKEELGLEPSGNTVAIYRRLYH